jgi:hypothetical protein
MPERLFNFKEVYIYVHEIHIHTFSSLYITANIKRTDRLGYDEI